MNGTFRGAGFSLFVIVVTVLWAPNPAAAAEQRCIELGPNCVCSEPLQATDYSNYGTNSHWNPNDTTSLECNGEGLPGAAVVRNAGSTIDLLASSDEAALSRLPPGHQVQRFLAGATGHRGIWFMGHTMPDGTTFAQRIALRYYIYHSPDYSFSDPTDSNLGCNAKLLQFDSGLLGDITHGAVHMYNFTTWPKPQDCCLEGPGPAGNNLSRADWLNKWWRVEAIMTNRNSASTGQHWRLQLYLKNVTDGAAEKLVVDTDAPGTQLMPVNPRIPADEMKKLLVNLFRGENVANQCFGWEGISHYMVAGWNTDEGQRIGPAFEVEGRDVGGGDGSGGSAGGGCGCVTGPGPRGSAALIASWIIGFGLTRACRRPRMMAAIRRRWKIRSAD